MHTKTEWEISDVATFDGRSIWLTGETQLNAQGDWVRERVWVVDQRKPYAKVLLPTPPMVRDLPFPFDRFVVSPDEQVIIGDRKVGSGMNATFVFRRTDGLRFQLMDRVSLNERVYRKYGPVPKRLRGSGTYCDTLEFVLFQSWLNAGRDALLACMYGESSGRRWYLVTLNTHTGRLGGHQPINADRVFSLTLAGERFRETRTRPLSHAEVAAYSPGDLRLAIAELLARRDYASASELQRTIWYLEPARKRSLTEIKALMFPAERANLALLLQVQAAAERKP